MDRMVVNAAIDELTRGESTDWLAAAQKVINFGLTIPPAGKVTIETVEVAEEHSQTVSGFAAGVGNVELEEPHKTEVKVSTTAPHERIGYYRMMHFAMSRTFDIRPFRQSGPFMRMPPEDGDPIGFTLSYTVERTPDLFLRTTVRRTAIPWRKYLRLLPLIMLKTFQGRPLAYGAFTADFIVMYSSRAGVAPGDTLDSFRPA